MIKTNVTDPLWDFCIATESDNMSSISCTSIGGRRPGLEVLTYDLVDIIEYKDFEFYNLI